jgi:hypothetical protein
MVVMLGSLVAGGLLVKAPLPGWCAILVGAVMGWFTDSLARWIGAVKP